MGLIQYNHSSPYYTPIHCLGHRWQKAVQFPKTFEMEGRLNPIGQLFLLAAHQFITESRWIRLVRVIRPTITEALFDLGVLARRKDKTISQGTNARGGSRRTGHLHLCRGQSDSSRPPGGSTLPRGLLIPKTVGSINTYGPPISPPTLPSPLATEPTP